MIHDADGDKSQNIAQSAIMDGPFIQYRRVSQRSTRAASLGLKGICVMYLCEEWIQHISYPASSTFPEPKGESNCER